MATGTLEQAVQNGRMVEDEPLYEIVNGERVEIPHMGLYAGSIANVLAFLMNQFAFPRKLGFAFVETLFQLLPGRPNRRPDVAFVARERWAEPPYAVGEDPAAWNVIPNAAIEVISPSNVADSVETKLLDYFEAGVELVWVIYPRQQRIYVYETPANARVLGINDELEGGTVLPGFRLKVADLFNALQKQA